MYEDRFWKIYQRPTAFPRAWLVHEALNGPPDSDLRKAALVARPLSVPLDAPVDQAAESVVIESYEAREIRLRAQAHGRALLILSEVFYPGWRATVNGQNAEIIEVNGALRGVPVPDGERRVIVEYAPRSVAVGAVFTLASFFALPFALAYLRRRSN